MLQDGSEKDKIADHSTSTDLSETLPQTTHCVNTTQQGIGKQLEPETLTMAPILTNRVMAEIDEEIEKSLKYALGFTDLTQRDIANHLSNRRQRPNILRKIGLGERRLLDGSDDTKSWSDTELVNTRPYKRRKLDYCTQQEQTNSDVAKHEQKLKLEKEQSAVKEDQKLEGLNTYLMFALCVPWRT